MSSSTFMSGAKVWSGRNALEDQDEESAESLDLLA